jgi:DNA-binding NtrC family response regulator
MLAPIILLLTGDTVFEAAVRSAAALVGCEIVAGTAAGDAATLLASHQHRAATVVVDLDNAHVGPAWLHAIDSQKVSAIAASRFNPQFLAPIARKQGVSQWVRKPIAPERLAEALAPALGAWRSHERPEDRAVSIEPLFV